MAAKLTRDRIVTVAQQALVDGGHDNVALRAVARQLGVTAPALYDHFRSRSALLLALAENGYRALIAATDVAGETAVERIRERAIAYVTFAEENPAVFQLMFLFRPEAVEVSTEDGAAVDNELAAATDAFEQAAADLRVAMDDGDLAEADIDRTALVIWTAMHGVATIALTAPSLAADIAGDVIDTLLAGLAANSEVDSRTI